MQFACWRRTLETARRLAPIKLHTKVEHVYYLYGSKRGGPSRLVATFGSEQMLLAYVRWATLETYAPQEGNFEQGSALASYSDAWSIVPRTANL